MTEVMEEDETVTFEWNHALFSAFTYVYGWPVLITHSWGTAFTVSEKSKNIYAKPDSDHVFSVTEQAPVCWVC